MKPILRTIVIVVSVCASARLARAQEVGIYLGFGSTHDGSNGAQIDTFGDGNLYKAPSLGGFIGHIGGSVFLSRHIAVGGEIAWRPHEADYAGIQYRPTFYTFDAIYRPTKGTTRRFAPEFSAGLGGARLTFFPNDPASCAQVSGCPTSHHFQVHLAAAARWYLTEHIFLRPALDVHDVIHFNEFGSGWVPEYSVGIGYSVGRRE